MVDRGSLEQASALVAAAQSADDALVVEIVGAEGHVDLVLGAARVPGVLRGQPSRLVHGVEYEVVVSVGDEHVGVCCVAVGGCRVAPGQVARVRFLGLDVAGRRLGPAPPAPALSGRLDEVAVADVVQLACVGRRDAVLELHTGAGTGVIHLHAGRAVYARCADGVGGERAFFTLVTARAGTFELRHVPAGSLAGSLENLDADTTWLLLEAMRRLDEGAVAGDGDDGAEHGVVPDARPATGDVNEVTNPMLPSLVARGLSFWSPSTSRLEAAMRALSSREASRDEERAAEPLLTPRGLRKHSQPPTAAEGPTTAAPTSAPTSSPQSTSSSQSRSSGPPLPSRATGRFARFFHELSETTGVRPATASLPPCDDSADTVDAAFDVDLATSECVAAALFDSDDGPVVDDDATARLRFASLRVPAAAAAIVAGPAERDTEVVRASRQPST
ncbi:MAG: DUF4388 domain-containing protein [Deltaproteobacteria bacterium]|nr:DUF4388 domain-containing protein [Deltaproteobacteria bacterium]